MLLFLWWSLLLLLLLLLILLVCDLIACFKSDRSCENHKQQQRSQPVHHQVLNSRTRSQRNLIGPPHILRR